MASSLPHSAQQSGVASVGAQSNTKSSSGKHLSFDLTADVGPISAGKPLISSPADSVSDAPPPPTVVDPQPPLEAVVLPPLKNEAFLSQRHEVNPAIALNLLEDMQTVVTTWQEQLRQIVQTIRALYAQGPMVDGWLESSLESGRSADGAADSTILRHGDADMLMQYVEALEQTGTPEADSLAAGSPAQYSLCCLDDEGQVQSQPCPAAQLAMVSTAIARYQTFKQLMAQKQALEAKLKNAVDQLTGVRAELHQQDSTG